MTVDVTQVRWKEVDGSIFTEASYKKKLETKLVELPLSVAFNVGREVAQHIVNRHNASLASLVSKKLDNLQPLSN